MIGCRPLGVLRALGGRCVTVLLSLDWSTVQQQVCMSTCASSPFVGLGMLVFLCCCGDGFELSQPKMTTRSPSPPSPSPGVVDGWGEWLYKQQAAERRV